jgi:hypothetical protein
MWTTPWFEKSTSPVRKGVYEVRVAYLDYSWSYFDGTHWNGAWASREAAVRGRFFYRDTDSEGCARDMTEWRGLTTKDGK